MSTVDRDEFIDMLVSEPHVSRCTAVPSAHADTDNKNRVRPVIVVHGSLLVICLYQAAVQSRTALGDTFCRRIEVCVRSISGRQLRLGLTWHIHLIAYDKYPNCGKTALGHGGRSERVQLSSDDYAGLLSV